MLLRSSFIRRLPFLATRLSCTSLPSTSASSLPSLAIYISPHYLRYNATTATLSKQLGRHIASTFVWVRGGHGKDFEEAKEAKEEKSSSDGNSKSGEEQEPLKPIMPPNKMKMFIVAAVLSFAVTSLLFTTLIAGDTVADNAIPADAPQVDFNAFAAKYLRAGEVQKITFVVGKSKAVATLFPGAIIDGRQVQSEQVVVNYAQPAQQFWADIRKEEAEMGISLAQGVDIKLLNAVSGWRMLEFFIGCFLLGWLCTQYGRLLMRKMAEERAKKAAK